jgi:hypothetical protein
MSFHDRSYHLHVILGDPTHPRIWKWAVWPKIAQIVDPLIAGSRGSAAVRSYQRDGNGKWIRFGRIGWNAKGHQKWTHGSPTNDSDSKSWWFLNMELWAPSWTICRKEGVAPDVYFAFSNEGFEGFKGDYSSLTFNPYLALGVAEQSTVGKLCEDVAANLAQVLNARLHAYQKRNWGLAVGDFGFSDAIGDLMVSSVFKPGPVHRMQPSLDLFRGNWDLRASNQGNQQDHTR